MNNDTELRAADHIARLALSWWRKLHDELTTAAGETVQVNRAAALYFTISAAAHSWRLGHAGESAERVQDAFERYSLARFVNMFSFPGTSDATVRESFMLAYRRVSPTYLQQLDSVFAKWTTNGPELLRLWALHLATTVLFRKPFPVGADRERTVGVVKAVLGMWSTAFEALPRFDPAAVAATPDPPSDLTVHAPHGWIPKARPPDEFDFYDPGRPEYHVWVTVQQPLENYDGSPPEMVGRYLLENIRASSGFCTALEPHRALISYRTSKDDSGLAKDDRHWWLFERDGQYLRRVFFTLSVLAERADHTATDELARQWAESISAARWSCPAFVDG
jgi:hypothetical protein